MSEGYAGLCIGGPMAGQRAVAKSQSLYVDTKPDLPPLSAGPTPIPDTLAIERVRYQWLHTGGFGLWIIEGMTLLDAVEAMALAYEAAHKTEPRPRRTRNAGEARQ